MKNPCQNLSRSSDLVRSIHTCALTAYTNKCVQCSAVCRRVGSRSWIIYLKIHGGPLDQESSTINTPAPAPVLDRRIQDRRRHFFFSIHTHYYTLRKLKYFKIYSSISFRIKAGQMFEIKALDVFPQILQLSIFIMHSSIFY